MMFAMNRLFRYSERIGDLLPGPSRSSSGRYLDHLEPLQEASQCGNAS